VAVVCLLLAAGAVTWWSAQEGHSALTRAMDRASPRAERMTFTGWAAVREAVGDPDDEQELLDAAFDADLSSTSALLSSSPGLEDLFGFSPMTLESEALAQGPDGALLVLQLGGEDPGRAVDRVRDHLRDLGFTAPDDDAGVWRGGPDVLSATGAGLTPELQHVALDRGTGAVLASDSEEFLQRVVEQDRSWWDRAPDGVREVAEASGEATSAVVYTADHACSALAMGQADDTDQSTAAGLVEAAGGLDPYTGFALAAQPDGDVLALMAFDDADTARHNADARAQLASGEAPGQGGTFGERFDLRSARADGDLVTLRLEPAAGAFVLSDLSSGPVLLASC